MRILSISGSRNPQGQTATAAEAVIAGFEIADGESERMFLPTMKINHCNQCNMEGWGGCQRGFCGGYTDDLNTVLDAIRGADAVLFSTPVYYASLAESMRALTDRMRRVVTHMTDPSGIVNKPAMALAVAGGRGGGSVECCLHFEKVLRTIGFDLVDVVPIRRQNLSAKCEQLKIAGEWLATLPHSN